MLHSVFSNGCLLSGRLFDLIRRLPQPKAYFIGNEYKLDAAEDGVLRASVPAAACLTNPLAACSSPIRERLRCAVVGIPNTGLDPVLFRAETPLAERPIDLGYRADNPDLSIGHIERRDITESPGTTPIGCGFESTSRSIAAVVSRALTGHDSSIDARGSSAPKRAAIFSSSPTRRA